MISIIVPALNEESTIGNCLRSLRNQKMQDFEVIVVDGGSVDKTVEIAKDNKAKVIVEMACPEFASRNIGARVSNGDILLFTCADVALPNDLLDKIAQKFENEPMLVAMTGPDVPRDSLLVELEYGAYNFIRYVFSHLPKPLRRFSTSTNFLAVRKNHFESAGGFIHDINADGLMGKKLSEMGKTEFCMDAVVFISTRRFAKMGFLGFNLHYIYVLENFFPFLSEASFLKRFKQKSRAAHGKLHEALKEN